MSIKYSSSFTNNTGKEGTFLVRQSTSRAGDYALSVIYKGQVHHFQIWRHGGDAFFSIGKKNIIHKMIHHVGCITIFICYYNQVLLNTWLLTTVEFLSSFRSNCS